MSIFSLSVFYWKGIWGLNLTITIENYWKKYSCVRVSISNMGFSWDLECWKEDKCGSRVKYASLTKSKPLCLEDSEFIRKLSIYIFVWLLEQLHFGIALELYFCPVAEKVKECLVVIWSKVLQFGLNGHEKIQFPLWCPLWHWSMELQFRSFSWYWHAQKLFVLVCLLSGS